MQKQRGLPTIRGVVWVAALAGACFAVTTVNMPWIPGSGAALADTHAGGSGGRGSGGEAGGRPVWAKEGIPDVELGRLNVARTPDRVLDRAQAEALATFTPDMAAFYALPLDQMILRLSTEFGAIAMLDSPLQNLALYKDALDGSSALAQAGVRNSTGTLLAAFLGTASDKSVPISAETVQAVSPILGYRLDAGTAVTLAQDAEAIRIAILGGHG